MADHPFELFTENTAQVTNNINDPVGDSLPNISVANAEVLEEAGQVTVNVVLDRANNNKKVVARYFTFDYDNQAVGWKDFIPQQGKIIFNRGETEKQIVIEIIKDNIGEEDKTFGLKIINPRNATVADDLALITIKDEPQQSLNENQPIISIQNNQIILPSSQNNQIEFTATLEEASETIVKVNYKTFSLSAIADEDFVPQEGVLTFAPGELTQSITVPILDNENQENIKAFGIELSEPENAQFSPQEVSYLAVGGILNRLIKENGIYQPIINSARPRRGISINDATIADNQINFTVSLNKVSNKPISVKYFPFTDAETDNLPSIPEDNIITFAPGEREKNIAITLPDNWSEFTSEGSLFGVKLYQSQGARIIDDVGVVNDIEITTESIGEEGGFTDDIEITTESIGEEGGFADDIEITTESIGEEGGFAEILPPREEGEITTLAIGEEGGFEGGLFNEVGNFLTNSSNNSGDVSFL